jgi:hypothetical protein
MRRWFEVFPAVLRTPDEPGGGGSDTIRTIDPGAEHEMDDEPGGDRQAPVVKKTAAEIRNEELEADNKRLKTVADQNAQDARYWADRARRNGGTPARASADDDERQPRRRAAEHEMVEKPEDLIDDLNKKGLQALKDRGFISKAELEQALEDVRTATAEDISEARNEAVFSGRLETEFPEMMEDSARVAKGLAPKSELFTKAGEIYRDLVDLDPSLKNSRGLLLIAARQAKAAITGKGGKGAKDDDDDTPAPRRTANDDDDQQRRRAKIQRQTPDRGRDDDDTDGGNHHSAEALSIMKHLKVKPEDFDRHRDQAPARRRK